MQTQLNKPEFDRARSKRYNSAMRLCPLARKNELISFEMDNNLSNPSVILEIGAGGGYLTQHLAKKFPNATIFVIDASKDMEKNIKQSKKIKILKDSKADNIKLGDNSVDLVFSLASFHHIANKKMVFKEIKRILTQNGLFLIGDVNDHTLSQYFFDDIVKKHCITGHDLDFLDENWAKYLANSSKLAHVSSKIIKTPWYFKNKKQMLYFVKNLFGLQIEESQLNKSLEKIFRYCKKGGMIVLPWQLGYHILKKEK